jgi:hypothetical protein
MQPQTSQGAAQESMIPPATTPAEARSLAENLLGAMKGLLDILEQETAMVRAGQVRDAAALEARKSEAASRYVRIASVVRQSASYLKQTTPDLLTTLHRHHDVFRSMLQVNLTVLATAHAVTEGIVRGVNGELQRKKMPQGYTSGGQRATPSPRHATPLSVSRSL